eukprot:1178163-Prorocentrum_minimum.AAC.2
MPRLRYVRHYDAVGANTDRVLTCIVYLNPSWEPNHGGHLRLHVPNKTGGATSTSRDTEGGDSGPYVAEGVSGINNSEGGAGSAEGVVISGSGAVTSGMGMGIPAGSSGSSAVASGSALTGSSGNVEGASGTVVGGADDTDTGGSVGGSGRDYVDVGPAHGRVVVFWSDGRVPHEVRPARRRRYAVSLWYYDTAMMLRKGGGGEEAE